MVAVAMLAVAFLSGAIAWFAASCQRASDGGSQGSHPPAFCFCWSRLAADLEICCRELRLAAVSPGAGSWFLKLQWPSVFAAALGLIENPCAFSSSCRLCGRLSRITLAAPCLVYKPPSIETSFQKRSGRHRRYGKTEYAPPASDFLWSLLVDPQGNSSAERSGRPAAEPDGPADGPSVAPQRAARA